MAEVVMMFSMDVKLENMHTSSKRRRISKAITSGRYSSILAMFDGRKILKQAIRTFLFKCDEQERQSRVYLGVRTCDIFSLFH